MKIYNYHPKTNELINSANARLDPLESKYNGRPVYMTPANATMKAPPSPASGKTAIFVNGKWNVVDDFRKTIMWEKETALEVEVSELGPIPDTLTDIEPDGDVEWSGTKWKPRILSKLEKILAIENIITNRRIREAILTESGKVWLTERENEIEAIKNDV